MYEHFGVDAGDEYIFFSVTSINLSHFGFYTFYGVICIGIVYNVAQCISQCDTYLYISGIHNRYMGGYGHRPSLLVYIVNVTNTHKYPLFLYTR